MWFWYSTPKFTCGVLVESGIIIETAPFLRKFVGQPQSNLDYWVVKNFKKPRYRVQLRNV